MTCVNWFTKYRLVLTLLVVVGLIQTDSDGQTARPRRIAVFGSSVAFGAGDEFGKEGYTGMLRQMLASRGWEVLNQSRGGDNTKTMAPRFAPEGVPDPKVRYLLPVKPGYVAIGLSLGNEGILEAKTKKEKDAVFQQYADGIKGFIDKARQHNIVPVVSLAYAHMVYTPVEYEYVRRINLLQNTWDAPSINFLGAVDDGTGRWSPGFFFDDRHPNAAGHRELFSTIVPTLFEALEKGKPTPTWPAARGFARITRAVAPLTFEPQETMHPFAVSFLVRAQSDGTVAAIGGSTLAAKAEIKQVNVRQGAPPRQFESITLSAERPFTAAVGVKDAKWTYTSANGTSVGSDVAADTQWHHILLSHYAARGETLFFVDGKLKGTVAERLEPTRFVLGGPGSPENPTAPAQADYKDFFLFRAALNPDEAAALGEAKLLQASLEIYAPLTDAQFRADSMVENRAQSMTALKVGAGQIAHVNESQSQ